jgi:hypothetical protein
MSDNNENRVLTDEEFDKAMREEYEEKVQTEKLLQENKRINAYIYNKKLKIQKKEMDRIANIQDSLENEDITKREFNRGAMLKELEDRRNSVTFLNPTISQDIVAAPGSLIVIPSMTNNGKSTLTAHIAEALVNENKRVLILSNEEKEEDVRARVSCLRTKVSFGDYKTSKCKMEEIEKVLLDGESLANSGRLVVISPKNETDAYKVTTVDGVMTTLNKAKNNFDAVIIDYYTNVNMSEFGTIEPWHVNNRLASELNIFKDTAPFPIIAMAQCEGIRNEKKVEDKGQLDFENNHVMYRWKGGKSILIYATDIIELVKDFNNSCSYLWAHKVRFSHGNLLRKYQLPFDKKMQRFLEEWTPEFDAKVTASKVTRESNRKSKELLRGVFEGKDEKSD